MSEEKSNKLLHFTASNFSSHHATGVALAGPSPDGSFHLLFYKDSVRMKSETLSQVEGKPGQSTISIQDGDILNFREDQTSISITGHTIMQLKSLLDEYEPIDNKSEVAE